MHGKLDTWLAGLILYCITKAGTLAEMKFGHDFEGSLEKGEFPKEWLDSAISYKQLKKCIKKVQRELGSLGLDTQTLNRLWKSSDGEEPLPPGAWERITPKMIVALDPHTGSPRDAWLTEETRRALSALSDSREEPAAKAEVKQDLLELARADSHGSSLPTTPPTSDLEDFVDHVVPEAPRAEAGTMDSTEQFGERKSSVPLKEVEMPLIANTEFFRVLRQELAHLDDLQIAEQKRVEQEITKLGQELAQMVQAGNRKSKTDVQIWREVFQVYVESEIFFSAREANYGTRNSEAASKQLELFASNIQSKQRLGKMTKEGRDAFERFMQINDSLLRYLRFQELNHTALRKIMKKFDKRTALKAQAMLPPRFAEKPFIAQSLARAACVKISEDLVTIVPQLNDYLCPICFSVSYKPIRLKCDHVFCIRCLIVMQRARQNHCPLCRGETVMEASSDNLDHNLMEFLKKTFPKEVKLKQKENEHAAGVDRYGENFDNAKCEVM